MSPGPDATELVNDLRGGNQRAADELVALVCDKPQTRVVELRLFGGLTGEQAQRILGVSWRTVKTDWKIGRTRLRREPGRGAE